MFYFLVTNRCDLLKMVARADKKYLSHHFLIRTDNIAMQLNESSEKQVSIRPLLKKPSVNRTRDGSLGIRVSLFHGALGCK